MTFMHKTIYSKKLLCLITKTECSFFYICFRITVKNRETQNLRQTSSGMEVVEI